VTTSSIPWWIFNLIYVLPWRLRCSTDTFCITALSVSPLYPATTPLNFSLRYSIPRAIVSTIATPTNTKLLIQIHFCWPHPLKFSSNTAKVLKIKRSHNSVIRHSTSESQNEKKVYVKWSVLLSKAWWSLLETIVLSFRQCHSDPKARWKAMQADLVDFNSCKLVSVRWSNCQ